jgi:hypothetical protein
MELRRYEEERKKTLLPTMNLSMTVRRWHMGWFCIAV